jgi:hypothetical protein
MDCAFVLVLSVVRRNSRWSRITSTLFSATLSNFHS